MSESVFCLMLFISLNLIRCHWQLIKYFISQYNLISELRYWYISNGTGINYFQSKKIRLLLCSYLTMCLHSFTGI